jgi:hypothetical protein
VSSPLFGALLAVLVVLLVVAIETAFRIFLSACQWCLKQPAFSRLCLSSSRSLPGEGHHDGPCTEQPRAYRSSHGRLLSSSSPASSSADLESAAIVAPLTLAAIDPAPNLSAFSAGVELAIFIALFTISSLLVLNWIVKTMRSSK